MEQFIIIAGVLFIVPFVFIIWVILTRINKKDQEREIQQLESLTKPLKLRERKVFITDNYGDISYSFTYDTLIVEDGDGEIHSFSVTVESSEQLLSLWEEAKEKKPGEVLLS